MAARSCRLSAHTNARLLKGYVHIRSAATTGADAANTYAPKLFKSEPLPITVIGAYPKPEYLKITDWFSTGAPGVAKTHVARESYEKELRAYDPDDLERDTMRATKEIVDEQVQVGVAIPTDGEVRRENYVYSFCRSLEGVSFKSEDLSDQNIRGVYTVPCPTVVGKLSLDKGRPPFVVDEWRKAQAISDVPVKVTIPGPMTICDTIAVDPAIEKGIYADRRAICEDLVPILQREVAALAHAGCKHIQIDEPVYARRVEEALAYGIDHMTDIFQDCPKEVIRSVHLCCGYPNHLDDVDYPHAPKENYITLAPALDASGVDWISIEDAHCKNDLATLLPLFKKKTVIFGAITVHRSTVESTEDIQERLEEALKYIDAERLVLAPDCGLGFLPTDIRLAKMRNLNTARMNIIQKHALKVNTAKKTGLDKQKYTNPQLCAGLKVHTVPMKLATNENLKGMGYIVKNPADFTVAGKSFEILPWPVQGWRGLDPGTGDEAGTTEGKFDIYWDGDFLYGKNHTIATTANHYLLGYARDPESCEHRGEGIGPSSPATHISLWYSDYHPDGGQLFFPEDGRPFVTNLAPPKGDSIKPEDFTAFYVPAGYGCYIHPGVWHNAVYTHPETGTWRTFFNRQGKVHARVSVNWAEEFQTMLRVPLTDVSS